MGKQIKGRGHRFRASVRASTAENQKTKISLPHSRYAIAGEKKREITCPSAVYLLRDVIWWNCFDARSVHWLHWYHCRPIVVAGESHCRFRSVAAGQCFESSLGVVSGANGRFHVRITLAVHGRTWSLSKRQVRGR